MTIRKTLRSGRASAQKRLRKLKFNGAFDIIVRTSGVELDEKIREAVTRKIGRVRQYAPEAFRARVQFDRDHTKAADNQYHVRVRYEIPGHDIIAEHRGREVMAVLDLVSEKIERRLRKRKTARLAQRLGRRARALRIADVCGVEAPDPTERR